MLTILVSKAEAAPKIDKNAKKNIVDAVRLKSPESVFDFFWGFRLFGSGSLVFMFYWQQHLRAHLSNLKLKDVSGIILKGQYKLNSNTHQIDIKTQITEQKYF